MLWLCIGMVVGSIALCLYRNRGNLERRKLDLNKGRPFIDDYLKDGDDTPTLF